MWKARMGTAVGVRMGVSLECSRPRVRYAHVHVNVQYARRHAAQWVWASYLLKLPVRVRREVAVRVLVVQLAA